MDTPHKLSLALKFNVTVVEFVVYVAPLSIFMLHVGLTVSLFAAAALVHVLVNHALSFIVTLHVPLSLLIVQLHHAVDIHDVASVLLANVAVKLPFVHTSIHGLYVQLPHTGATVSFIILSL